MDHDKERRIRERAYAIWEREGRPQGRDSEHWKEAEAEIAAEVEPVLGGSQPGNPARPAPEPSAQPASPPRRSRAVPPGESGPTPRRKPGAP